MSLPSEVTSRGEGNDFIATTGMVLTGITGFGIRTGFYLTNSGSHPIETTVGYNDAATPTIFDFPSGQHFTLLAGKSKFIPFEFVFVQDNISGPTTSNLSTGPDVNGKYENFFTLSTVSQFDGQSDSEGSIRVNVTGQVTGFKQVVSGPASPEWFTTGPAHPSGFLVTTDYGRNGKPECVLRWQHPSTGYYFKRYQVDYAGNIEDSSVSTGSWTGLTTFDINFEQKTYSGPSISGPFTYEKYATNTGIAQLHTRGTEPNPPSPYGEYTVSDLGFDANYYFRIKSQYIDRDDNISYESPYVYGYPVDNFDVAITDNDINYGLLSGNVAKAPDIANATSSPQSLDIYFTKGQQDINLKTVFDDELTNRGATVNAFDNTHADYAFTGVNFIVPEDTTVGSVTEGTAGITTGGQLKYGSTEIKSVLTLKARSRVYGAGGSGGDGGFTDINIGDLGSEAKLQYRNYFKITKGDAMSSTDGGDGSPAIHINDTSIGEFRIRKHPESVIYGGGGGGGGGDPFFFPKAFTLDPTYLLANYFRNDNNQYDAYIREGADGENKLVRRSRDAGEGTALAMVKNPTSSNESVSLTLKYSDILGTQLAGFGGGGQGFGISLGGTSLKSEQGSTTARFATGQGSSEGAGYGSLADMSIKLSPGANGGIFGEDGINGLNANAGALFKTEPDEKPGVGGKGGEAIKIIAGNSNYSNLNSLLDYPEALEPTTTNFPSLLAWFTSSDASKFNLTTSGSYKYVDKWTSKNDANIYITFPWTGSSNNKKPLYIEAGTTTNSISYTKPFNEKNIVFFGATGATAGKLVGLGNVSGKLEMDMDGFEIVYFLYPGAMIGDTPSQLALKWNKSAFRIFEGNDNDNPLSGKFFVDGTGTREGRKAGKGWGLHQWTLGPSSLLYYTDQQKNMISENTGLLNNKITYFSDFTNGKSPNRAWMYSISASRHSGGITYEIFNDLNKVHSQVLPGLQRFKWFGEPIIGKNSGLEAANGNNVYAGWYGGISDIIVFKKSLVPDERAALFSYIANQKLRVPAVRYYTVTSHSTEYKANLQSVRIRLTSTPEYIFAGRKIIFSNGAIFTFTRNANQSGTPINVRGTLTADIPASTSGTLYPIESKRNTVSLKNGFAGFNEGPQW